MRAMTCFLLMSAIAIPAVGFAGIYDPALTIDGPEPTGDGARPMPYGQLRNVIVGLMSINVQGTGANKDYIKKRNQINRRDLNDLERLDLGACLIRLRQYDDAIDILTPLAGRRGNFMVYANIGTAQMLAGRMDRAASSLEEARDAWPDASSVYSKEQLDWFRTVEKYQLRLVRLRYAESLRPSAGRGQEAQKVDDLFADDKSPVRYIGESGQYEAGKIAAKEFAKLPRDAVAIVQQLLIWMPYDTRLYWQLGELYNASGNIAAASMIFEDCVWNRRYDAAELRAHRQIVQSAKPKSEPLVLEPETPVRQDETPPSWLPDTRKLIILGCIAGPIALLLIYFQFHEMRRRRRLSD